MKNKYFIGGLFTLILSISSASAFAASERCNITKLNPNWNEGYSYMIGPISKFTKDPKSAYEFFKKTVDSGLCELANGCSFQKVRPDWNDGYSYFATLSSKVFWNSSDTTKFYNKATAAGLCND